jgi:endonuclease G
MAKYFNLLLVFLLLALPAFAQQELACPRIQEGEIIIRHTGHMLSYDTTALIPRWVAYELRDTDMEGDARRAAFFSPDSSPLLEGYPLAEHWHYSYTGWARGHMAPAGDFKYDQAAMDDTFYTTNVCPMDLTFNNSIWKRLEEKTRKLALEFGRVYIVTGPILGTNKNGKVGESEILIPDEFFKALLVPCDSSYVAIGFLMPNEDPPKGYRLRDYAVTIGELESLTGMIFFDAMDEITACKIKEILPLKELGLF